MSAFASYLSTLRRLSAVVERLRTPRRRRQVRKAAPMAPVFSLWSAPPPRVLPSIVAASLEEGLLTDAEAHELAELFGRAA